MDYKIQILLNEIPKATYEEKISNLIGIGDYVEFGYTFEVDLIETVQQLVDLLPSETEPKVLRLLFRNIEIAYTQPVDLSTIKFDSILKCLEEKDAFFICGFLYILSMTYKKQYVPVITKYLDHADKKVREEAEIALTYLP